MPYGGLAVYRPGQARAGRRKNPRPAAQPREEGGKEDREEGGESGKVS